MRIQILRSSMTPLLHIKKKNPTLMTQGVGNKTRNQWQGCSTVLSMVESWYIQKSFLQIGRCLLFYQYCPRMEQNTTWCICREILSINLEALVCKLVLAEYPDSKNMTGARDASIMKAHLMRTDLYKLISVYVLPEAADNVHHYDSSYQTVCPPKAQPKIAAVRNIRKGLCIIWKIA